MSDQLLLPGCLPPSSWIAPNLSLLPSWAGIKRIGLDIEANDPDLKTLGPGVRRGGYIVGISFAFEDGPSHYLPFAHSEDNLDKNHVLAYIHDNASTFTGDIVGANLQYDLDYLAEAGIKFPKVGRFRDIQVAEPLIDELQFSYSMENISKRHGLLGKDETLLRDSATFFKVDPKKELWKLPARYVGPYATQDAVLPLAILRKQERIIEDQDLSKIYDLECRLLPVLLKMRRRGVRIDLDKLQWIEDWTYQEQRKALDTIHELTGIKLHLDDLNNKDDALLKPLRTIANINIKKTATGKDSIDKELLMSLKHPVADAILRAKKFGTLRNTFVAGVRHHITNGRIHCSFNQMKAAGESEDGDEKGVRYGRLSSSNPNLTNQPARDEETGPKWREIYLPDEGKIWASSDFSGQEPRMLVHYANISNCKGVEATVRRYNEDPDMNFHKQNAEITGVSYKNAKTIGLGLSYGMGGAKLARSMDLATTWVYSKRWNKQIEVAGPIAQDILDKFNKGVPFLKELQMKCQRRAEERGYIITIYGRRLRFPVKQTTDAGGSIEYEWTHKATNRLIQGSAADQTKLSIVTCDDAGLDLQIAVHDEVDFSSDWDGVQAKQVAEIMMTCLKLTVPNKVDVETGVSWGDSMKKG